MKDQFEKNIKSLVEDFSYDYDPKAWEAFSKKLPKANGGTSRFAQFVIAAIVSAGIFTIWTNTSTTPTQKAQPVLTTKRKSIKPKIDSPSNITPASTQKFEPHQTSNKAVTPISENSTEFTNLSTFVFDPQTTVHTAPAKNLPENPRAATESITKISSLKGTALLLPQPETAETNINCQGMKIILTAESMNYETGVPIIHINAETPGFNTVWKANGSLINQKTKSADLLAFKQQTYEVQVQTSNEECQVNETITMVSDQNYNLLAVNAFNPQSRDERNARFMPFALTIRDVRFELIIIDPDNGAVLFKSTDAQYPWDGIDQRTGQLVAAQKAFIWKVLLENPLPGEKNTYSGTIVRI
jgi:hypothetical protein